MPASQAGRHGFDPRRPLQIFKINDLDLPPKIFFPKKGKMPKRAHRELATGALCAGRRETGRKPLTEKLQPRSPVLLLE
jgi:hypothetical protein